MELKPDQESILLNAARLRRRHEAQVPKCLNIIAYQLPSRLASVTRRWLASATNKVEAINRRGNMTSAPSWNQQNWTTPPKPDIQRDDLIRDFESSLSRSMPRPSNQQNWTTPPKPDNQRDGLDRELEYLSRGAPRPSNQQDWTTRPKSDKQN